LSAARLEETRGQKETVDKIVERVGFFSDNRQLFDPCNIFKFENENVYFFGTYFFNLTIFKLYSLRKRHFL